MKSALALLVTFAVATSACNESRRRTVDAGDAALSQSIPDVAGKRAGPLLVTVVVDQLAAWTATERWPKLPEGGGFRRLTREGTWVRSMRYAHAVTDTAPGHAALYTGAVPRESGIFGNEIVGADRDVVSVLRDASVNVVYPSAIDPGVSSSGARLRVDTVADRLRDAHPEAFIVSLSLKDRGAILPAGKRPTAAVWLDTKQARFVTSTAFTKTLPPWVDKRGDQSGVLRSLNTPWTLSWKGATLTPDDQAGEGDESGLGRVFPHTLELVRSPARVFRTVPVSDDVLLGMALDALDARSGGETALPALVALSLSAHDYIGHVFGPDSVEAWDELARLDRALGTFFSELDKRFGADGWSAVLTADHGTTTMPEAIDVRGVRHWCGKDAGADTWQRPCGPIHRIDLEEMTAALVTAAQRVLPGKKDLVRGTADPYVFVGDGARALSAADRAKLDVALRGVLEKSKGVRRVFAVDALPRECPKLEGDDALAEDDRIAALVCRSALSRDEHVGALYVVVQPGSFFDPRIVRGHGTSHGSPYLYDRSVPLVARSPGRVAAGRVIDEPVDFRAFAKTVSALLSIDPPPAAQAGRSLATR